jgi:DNA-binding NarL/FixJ family response regulator
VKALALIDQGLAIATELSMDPLQKLVAALLLQAQSLSGRLSAHPKGLTERQVEVLRLLAEGKTNREIAQELILSHRTVQRHISDIYDKIGARNRSDATAFTLRYL